MKEKGAYKAKDKNIAMSNNKIWRATNIGKSKKMWCHNRFRKLEQCVLGTDELLDAPLVLKQIIDVLD